jgi:hypothetical protein
MKRRPKLEISGEIIIPLSEAEFIQLEDLLYPKQQEKITEEQPESKHDE